ncbi:predicted protein, partial [Nematostella vectensis]
MIAPFFVEFRKHNIRSTFLPNIYINNLPNCFEHPKPRMYADDTHLTFESNNIEDINLYLNQDLANVGEWLVDNMLTLNQSK